GAPDRAAVHHVYAGASSKVTGRIVRLRKRVLAYASVDCDSDLGLDRVGRARYTAEADLLLNGADRVDVNLGRPQLTHRLDQAVGTDPVVEVATRHDV